MKKQIRKLKFLQFIALFSYLFFAAAAPIIYAIVRTSTGTITFNFALSWAGTHIVNKGMGLSITFLFTIVLAVLNSTNAIKKFYDEAQFGFFKQAVTVVHGALLPGILFALAFYIKSWKNGSEAFIIVGSFMLIARSIIRPWQNFLAHELGRETRKQEMREVLHEND